MGMDIREKHKAVEGSCTHKTTNLWEFLQLQLQWNFSIFYSKNHVYIWSTVAHRRDIRSCQCWRPTKTNLLGWKSIWMFLHLFIMLGLFITFHHHFIKCLYLAKEGKTGEITLYLANNNNENSRSIIALR